MGKLQQKIDEMEDTLSIKDKIFAELPSTTEPLKERESLIDEIGALNGHSKLRGKQRA